MAQSKIVKPVSLNPNREEEALILKHVKRRNFSGYVKKLILADISARKEEKRQEGPAEAQIKRMPKEEQAPPARSAAEVLQEMKKKRPAPMQAPPPNVFIKKPTGQ